MKRTLLICTSALLLLMNANPSQAGLFRRYTDYLYVSDTDVSVLDEVICYTGPAFVYGNIHCNETIGVKYDPQFYGLIFLGGNRIFENAPAIPWFAHEPYFEFPLIAFPDTLSELREIATSQGHFFENPDSTLQFRCTTGETGWLWWSWPVGEAWDSSSVTAFDSVAYGQIALFFDGPLQLFGENIEGNVTIGAAGDIRIMDNIVIAPFEVSGNTMTVPDTIPGDNLNTIGIASERNIFIANTMPNGRENGAWFGGGHNRHSIVITAALLALNDRFTFEDQNDPWDDYIFCAEGGPNEDSWDQRGTIHFFGSVANVRRGYTQRSNCIRTGYWRDFNYDVRFEHLWPAYLPEITWAERPGLVQNEVWTDTVVTVSADPGDSMIVFGTLTMGPGASLEIEEGAHVRPVQFYGSDLFIEGTPDNPASIHVTATGNDSVVPFGGTWENIAGSHWRNLEVFGENITLLIPEQITGMHAIGDQLTLVPAGSLLDDENAYIDIDSSVFRVDKVITLADSAEMDRFRTLTYTEVTGDLTSQFDTIDHCTFVFESGQYLRNHDADGRLEISNTCLAGADTLLSSLYSSAIDHSALYTLSEPAIRGFVERGEHLLEGMDPLFEDLPGYDYHLQENSPLIDAGDPDFPYDPDTTVTDIGVHYFYHLGVPSTDKTTSDLPRAFAIESVYPNPFNPSTKIRITLPKAGLLTVSVYDVLGREVRQLAHENLAAGMHCFTLNGTALASGTYFVQATSPQGMDIRKILLLK